MGPAPGVIFAASPGGSAGGNKPGIAASAGLACCTALIAVNFTHPIEVCKTRLQVGNFNFSTMVSKVSERRVLGRG